MPAIGGGSSGGVTRSAHGALWYDVRDYGAKADGGVTDNTAAFQAAFDAGAAVLQDS